jgi:hypothetical protein
MGKFDQYESPGMLANAAGNGCGINMPTFVNARHDKKSQPHSEIIRAKPPGYRQCGENIKAPCKSDCQVILTIKAVWQGRNQGDWAADSRLRHISVRPRQCYKL